MHTLKLSVPVFARKLGCCYTNADTLINFKLSPPLPIIICISEISPKIACAMYLWLNFIFDGYDCFCSEFLHHNRSVCIYVRSILMLRNVSTEAVRIAEFERNFCDWVPSNPK